jgi:hypothetical protein
VLKGCRYGRCGAGAGYTLALAIGTVIVAAVPWISVGFLR